MGRVHYGPTDAEKPSFQEQRSLYIVKDMRAGEVITNDNLHCIRPGFGLAPRYYHLLLGKRVNQHVAKGTPMSWELGAT